MLKYKFVFWAGSLILLNKSYHSSVHISTVHISSVHISSYQFISYYIILYPIYDTCIRFSWVTYNIVPSISKKLLWKYKKITLATNSHEFLVSVCCQGDYLDYLRILKPYVQWFMPKPTNLQFQKQLLMKKSTTLHAPCSCMIPM